MSKLTNSEKKKLADSLRYIPLPIMCWTDDNLWIKANLKRLPERYRQEVATLYSVIFFKQLHDKNIPILKRKGVARKTANTLLLNIVEKMAKGNSNDNDF
ncbi:hypothetical protein FP371_24550 [Citrobacter freundii]|uniref:hypothetical protein n=1 Tax=Gammaproteobacteria TaxID=1236 RepID=UPI0005CFACA1|nr:MULTISPECIES: hypothetical protein [Gammaproteobacteria]EES8921254.1 hypothetical protein [Escherichia coli]EES9862662.1 hypothetical protein [Escherichia coli]ELE4828682.1 hypothetical protein [Escherichia coli]MBD5651545.1 hypothetical protein [Citrobacter freundii]MBD5697597.1 hypothetical protein [Citrobacter freundii]